MRGDTRYTLEVNGSSVAELLGDSSLTVLFDKLELDPPEQQTSYVDVPGRDGSIDMSEVLTGYPAYKDRTVKTNVWVTASDIAECDAIAGKALAELHGKTAELKFSFDTQHRYIGRVSVSNVRRNGLVVGFLLTARCEPYRFKEHVTETADCAGGHWFELANGTAHVVPVFTASTEASIYDPSTGESFDIQAGTFRIPDIVLKPGENRLFVATIGTGGTERVIDSVKSQYINTYKDTVIADWAWTEKPSGGEASIDYDWKDL